jgi:hypothetical protein
MKNDAKFGMLAGVLGVIVAAVIFANAPPPSAQSRPGATGPPAKDKPAPVAAAPNATNAPAASASPEVSTAALPSTPVGRTRKEVEGQSTSRQGGEEEP